MAVTIADFETLQYCSIVNLDSMGWSAPLLQASYGAGYGAGVLANSNYGLHRWSLTSEIIPDTDSYAIDYDVDGGSFSAPKFTYFLEFFKRHILRGNKPFIVLDNREGKSYLVSFEAPDINFGRITAKFFSAAGIGIIERRHPDLNFNSDGSLDLSGSSEIYSIDGGDADDVFNGGYDGGGA